MSETGKNDTSSKDNSAKISSQGEQFRIPPPKQNRQRSASDPNVTPNRSTSSVGRSDTLKETRRTPSAIKNKEQRSVTMSPGKSSPKTQENRDADNSWIRTRRKSKSSDDSSALTNQNSFVSNDDSNFGTNVALSDIATTMKLKTASELKEVAQHSRAREEDYGHLYTGSSKLSPDMMGQVSGSSIRDVSPLFISNRDPSTGSIQSPRLDSRNVEAKSFHISPMSSEFPTGAETHRDSNSSMVSRHSVNGREPKIPVKHALGSPSGGRLSGMDFLQLNSGQNFAEGASPRHSSEISSVTGVSSSREEDYPSFTVNRGSQLTLSSVGYRQRSNESKMGVAESDTRSEANRMRRVKLPEGEAANELLFGGGSSPKGSRKVLLMGPDEAGDVIVCVRKGFEEEEQQEVVAALLSSRLLLKVRHLELLQDFAANEGQDEYIECNCNCCFCCRCKCKEQDMCCLMNCANKLICGLMPPCLVQHDVRSSGLSFVIFVGASISRLNEEHLLLQRERWAQSNSLSVTAANEIKYRDVFTPAERSQLLYRIVERAVAPRSGVILRKHPAVKSITVLHDPSFLVNLLQWTPETIEDSSGVVKRWEDATKWERFVNHFSTYINGSVMAHEMRPITKQTIEYGGRQLPKGEMFIHEIRAQYGERVAYLFAYNRFFVQSLYFILVPGLFVQIVHFVDGIIGRRLNTIFGLFVSVVWSPLFQVLWDRKAAEYAFMWNVNTLNFHEADYPNPDFQGEERIDPITQMKVRFYPQWKRYIQYFFRILLLILFYVVWLWAGEWIIMIFVSIRSRFDDPPWLALSILKDIIHGTLMAGLGNAVFHGWAWALVNCENYETEGKRDKHLIYTFFAMDFWNMFVLLFLLAFFFIPLKHGGWYAHAFHVEGTPLNKLWWQLFDTPVHNATIIQGRLDWEKMEIVMIGPIVVMRILITITMSVLPFCMQRRRRAAVRKAMAQRSEEIKEWFTTVNFLVRPAKWARSKVIGTAVEVGKGMRDRTYSMSATVSKTLSRSTSFMRHMTGDITSTDNEPGSEKKSSDVDASSNSHLLSLPGASSENESENDLEDGKTSTTMEEKKSDRESTVSNSTSNRSRDGAGALHVKTLSTIQSIGSVVEELEEKRISPARVAQQEMQQGAVISDQGIEMTSYPIMDGTKCLNSSAISRPDTSESSMTSTGSKENSHGAPGTMGGALDGDSDTMNMRAKLQAIAVLQQYHRAHRARSIVFERRMALKSADDLVEECGAGEFEMFFIYIDLLMQYGILTFFICSAPWIVVIMAALGAFEVRIRTYNLAYASRPPPPRKAANIGPWRECLRFLARMALPVNGLVMTLSMGLLDSWFDCPEEHKSQQFLDPRMYKLWMYISTLSTLSWDDGTFDDNMINEEQCVSYTSKFIFFGAIVVGGFIMHQVVYWIVPPRPQWVTDQIKLRLHQQKEHFLRQHPKLRKLSEHLIDRHMDKAWAMLETAKYSKRGAVVRGDWTQNVNDMDEYQNLTERVLGRSLIAGDKRRGSGADAAISASVADAVTRSHISAGIAHLDLTRSNSDPERGSRRVRSNSHPTTASEEENAAMSSNIDLRSPVLSFQSTPPKSPVESPIMSGMSKSDLA